MSNGSGLDNPDRKVTSPVADISTAPASKRIISHGVRSLKDTEKKGGKTRKIKPNFSSSFL